MFADVCDCQGVFTDGVLDPLSVHHFVRDLQTEHVFVKFTRTFHVRNGCRDKSDFLNFHFAFAALTAFFAASARSSAVINSTLLSFSSCFPFSTLVPSSLTI